MALYAVWSQRQGRSLGSLRITRKDEIEPCLSAILDDIQSYTENEVHKKP